MTTALEDRERLYGLDEAVVMIPYEQCETASKARYAGWQELLSMGMHDEVTFDPRFVEVSVRWMFRYTDDPFAELTHRYGDPMTPGAFKVWMVKVDRD